jgi:hypothetical protein
VAGADVDARDDEGNTPMHFAVSRGALESVRLLLRYGADPLATNAQRKSPITMAAASRPTSSNSATAASPPAAVLPTGGDATDSVEVTFTEEGVPLGLSFAQFGETQPAEIEKLAKGGQAARLFGDVLKPGMALTAVQGVAVVGYEAGVSAIQAQAGVRPLKLRFAPSSREAEAVGAARAEESILLDQNLAAQQAAADKENASPMERLIAAEQETSFGQWLQKRHMRGYARSFVAAGLLNTVSVLQDGVLEDAARLATMGVKFAKKDAKKIAKLIKKSNKKVKAEREL